ncbi:hypothetical protein [Plasticicumulans lactativorans]|uniref:hypothetical protein n=1 Tax=Plasticicumulans lactativorans TaxID=1133106 RepID=UPI00104C0587|nr:hypothetical protein [Plasticicumulans lactativorans]
MAALLTVSVSVKRHYGKDEPAPRQKPQVFGHASTVTDSIALPVNKRAVFIVSDNPEWAIAETECPARMPCVARSDASQRYGRASPIGSVAAPEP